MRDVLNQVEPWLAAQLAAHPVAAPAIFVAIRIVSVVIAVIPGAAIDVPGILFFGWLRALVLAELGVMAGAMTCFWIGRRFREPIVRRFAKLGRVQAWEARLSRREALWTWVGIRLTTNIGFDYISYAAGLTGCTARLFFFSTLLGSLPNMFLFFYLGGAIKNFGYAYAVAAIVGLMMVGIGVRSWKARQP